MKYVLIAGIVIIGIFLIVLSFIPLGIEPLTELYFENHTALPSYLFLNKLYNFSFTVHNLEYQKVKYEYFVKIYDGNENLIDKIDYGEFYLSNNETKTIYEDFSINKPFERAKIEVNISKNLSIETPAFKKKLWWPDPNYPTEIDIHFWIEEITGPKINITED